LGPEVLVVGAIVMALGALSGRLRGTNVATTWANGRAALSSGRYAEAETCFRTTLAAAERRFGPDHWRIAVHLDALAQALIGQKRVDEAGPLVVRALTIASDASEMPRAHLATVLLGAAALDGARELAPQAMKLVERARAVAADDPTVLAAVERSVARLEAGAGHDAEAADALARIPFDQLEATDARPLARAGLARLLAGDVDRAARCLTSALAVAERESPGTFAEAFYRGLLGEALARAGRDGEALVALDQAVIDYDAIVGENHPATATLLIELADVRVRLGDGAGARVACERVLSARAPQVARSEDPYRDGPSAGDPVGRERDRARALLARLGGKARA
jgi:tetratricopeptide (TPR) repeat protein